MSMFGNLSANQINAGMGLGPGGVGDQSQALFNNLYGPQGFGGQTAQYAGAGAAYGRGTGYYGDTGAPSAPTPAPANTPQEQAYFAAYPDVAASGMTAEQHYMLYGRQEGRNAFGLDTTPGDFPSDGTSPYNTYGQPGAGQGGYDPYGTGVSGGGYNSIDAQAGGRNFNDTFGAVPGQPYGPGYFDASFGSANSQPQQTGFSPYQTYNEPGTGTGGYDPTSIWGGAAWDYMNANPDVASAVGWNPAAAIQHYQTYGANEGRAGFGMQAGGNADAQAYLAANPDVAAAAQAAGGDPLQYARWHENTFGKNEGRGWGEATGAAKAYYDANTDVYAAAVKSGMDLNTFAEKHYQDYGWNEGRSAHGLGLSAEERYLNANPDVAASGMGADQHYQQFGQHEGRTGFGLQAGTDFNSRFGQWGGATPEQMQNQPAIDAVNGFARGVPQLRDFGSDNPFLNFAGQQYLQANPDVAAAHVDPLQHYLQYGRGEGRSSFGLSGRDWTTDSYGNPVPPGYGSTGTNMYDPSAYPGQDTGFNQFGLGIGTPTYMALHGSPPSGVVGPQPDTFTGFPYGGGQSSFDYRYPQGMPPAQDQSQIEAGRQGGISSLQQLLQYLDSVSGGGSTLSGQDLFNR